MKKIFRKAITTLGSAALVGATVGAAAASAFPASFTDAAVVYGASAAPSDLVGASNVVSAIDAASTTTTTTTLVGAVGETEDEIVLGANVNATGKLTGTALTDSKIPSLLDTKLNWDDGGASGADNYNYHEEIRLGTMAIKTTADDNDFEGAALNNDKQLEYRFVFDDAFNVTGVGDGITGSDDLYLTILGKEYEVSAMTASSITVVTSEEYSLSIGESVTVGGNTFTVDDVYSGDVQVNGELISDGATKNMGNGYKVKIKSIGYHSNSPELSKAILQIGEEISETFTDGEAYVGEDEDDPQWIWTMNTLSTADGYVGIKYNYKETRDTDDVAYVGNSYIFPENFAEVKFDKLTEVDYLDYKVYFDDTEDLWNSTDLTSTAQTEDAPVLIIEAVDGTKDAIRLADGATETSKVYLRWSTNSTVTETAAALGGLEVFYSDVDGSVSDSVRPRFSTILASTGTASATVGAAPVADLRFGDAVINVSAEVTGGGLYLNFTDGSSTVGDKIGINVGGDAVLQENASTSSNLKWFGENVEATDKEDGLAADLGVNGVNVGTYDNDILNYYGIVVEAPEGNLDNDEVILSVPSDQVYATVSVVAGGDATTTGGEAGGVPVKDTEVSTVAGKDLVVVGGSAINSVAADLLGGAYSGAEFTSMTGVGAGEGLIQSFDRSGNTALLVAGYNAEDTEMAVDYLINQAVDTTIGTKLKVTSTTEATSIAAAA